MSGAHSFLAASAAEVWVHCAGHPLMASMYPEEDTIESKEGEASHWVVSSVLSDLRNTPQSMIGKECPDNNIVINEDMAECAKLMIDDVLSVLSEVECGLVRLHIEERIEIIPSVHQLNGGTPDAWVFNDETSTLHLWDYKYGHKDVPADSWQNKNYVAGILDILANRDESIDVWAINVVMKIVQPRSYNDEGPIKEYRCVASDLRDDFERLRSQAELAVTADPGVKSGNHCRYCPARHACPAALDAASSAVDYAMSAIPTELSDEGLSFELALLERATKAIEHRYAAIKEDAINRISQGAMIRGYGIKDGVGNRKYNAPADEIATVGESLGIDMYKPSELITPAQFDKRLAVINKRRKADGNELIDKNVISHYIDRPSTGAKLVPSTETLAVKAFKRL